MLVIQEPLCLSIAHDIEDVEPLQHGDVQGATQELIAVSSHACQQNRLSTLLMMHALPFCSKFLKAG